jgi:2-polyprenyl-3-methyl-5-hydroxy-6-metoxy-1,4-benzoquinol methylase
MNAHGKTIDKTFLSIETAQQRGFIHRDYIAHVLRWTHVAKWLSETKRYDKVRILDVGCGKELPLPMMLYSMKMFPPAYYGIDIGPVNDDVYQALTKTGKCNANVFEDTDIMSVTLDDLDGEKVDVLTCFEMVEHIEPDHMLRYLRHVKTLLKPTATAFFSTPCWNRMDCAANHVNEMLYEALGAVFEQEGWTVLGTWGTFASIRDYEGTLQASHPEWYQLFKHLREYYDTNFLSCIFAPVFPAKSRNCLWQVCPVPPERQDFPTLEEIKEPWGSSANYPKMRNVLC